MNKPKVSIIVPVHNAGPYFEKCLASLVNQSLRDIEIILILDCPTDGSDKVAEKYARKDNRIKLIYNEENIHTGLSRNKGIEIARGEFIGFMDHDDYCETSMYEMLYKEAKLKELDVVRCNFKCIYSEESGTHEESYIYPTITEDVTQKKQIYEKVCNDGVSCVIWNHIFKTDFLKQKNILFLDSTKICSEDSIFFIQVYQHLDKLGIIPDYLYYHVFHKTNTGKNYNYRSIQNRILFFERLYSFLEENSIGEEESLSYLSANIMKSLYSGSRQALMLLPLKKALNEIYQIPNNHLIMNCISYMYKKENSKNLRKLKPTIRAFFLIIKIFAGK